MPDYTPKKRDYTPNEIQWLGYDPNDPKYDTPEQFRPQGAQVWGPVRPMTTRDRNQRTWDAMSKQITRAGTSYDAGSEAIRQRAHTAGQSARVVGDNEGGRLTGFDTRGERTDNHNQTVDVFESPHGQEQTHYMRAPEFKKAMSEITKDFRRRVGGYKGF